MQQVDVARITCNSKIDRRPIDSRQILAQARLKAGECIVNRPQMEFSDGFWQTGLGRRRLIRWVDSYWPRGGKTSGQGISFRQKVSPQSKQTIRVSAEDYELKHQSFGSQAIDPERNRSNQDLPLGWICADECSPVRGASRSPLID